MLIQSDIDLKHLPHLPVLPEDTRLNLRRLFVGEPDSDINVQHAHQQYLA